MRPTFQIIADGRDITALLRDRLVSLRIVDKPGVDADEVTVTIDDRDGAVALPRRGAMLEVSLGYEGEGLTRIGRYRVDEVCSSGPPQQVVFSGRAADMSGKLKQVRRDAWEGVPLADIVGAVAGRNGLQPVCEVKATVPRVDQLNESDLHFITRLARQYDATATVKGGKLLVLPRGGQSKTASGKPLPVLLLARRDITSWSYRASDREAAGGATVRHHDPATGKTSSVTVGDAAGAPARVVRHAQATPGQAAALAKSAADRAARAEVSLSLSLPGRADLLAERKLRTDGIKPGIDGLWTIDSVEHEFSEQGGWETRLELVINPRAEKAKNGKKQGQKKSKAPLMVLKPE